ncbi:E3 ubiquitin-protein ligase At4g11680 [Linum grandiflorum]
MQSSTSSSPPPSPDVTAPLLTRSIADRLLRGRGLLSRPSMPLRGLLRRASSRRLLLREPSVRVRENAAEQLEERQTDWSYSTPVIALDVLWNLAFVAIAAVALVMSVDEKPGVPLRLWIVGYGLQCLLHIGCVVGEYRRRRRVLNLRGGSRLGFVESDGLTSGSAGDDVDSVDYQTHDDQSCSATKQMESANTMFSLIWWLVGFYWITDAGQNPIHDSPLLYWLCVAFLAFDVIFVIICIAIACLVGVAICCCLPCIIAVLYAITDQEGATKEEIDQLPKFKFRRVRDVKFCDEESQAPAGEFMSKCDDSLIERSLPEEDAECCICLSSYDDGTEVRELPCRHHFHCPCIDKWLYMNATCPLCKFNISKAGNQGSSEQV